MDWAYEIQTTTCKFISDREFGSTFAKKHFRYENKSALEKNPGDKHISNMSLIIFIYLDHFYILSTCIYV